MHAWSRGGSLVDLEGEHGPASPLQLRGVPPHARGEHDQARVLRGRNIRLAGGTPAHADLAASITRVLGMRFWAVAECHRRISKYGSKRRIFRRSLTSPWFVVSANASYRSECGHQSHAARGGDEHLHRGLRPWREARSLSTASEPRRRCCSCPIDVHAWSNERRTAGSGERPAGENVALENPAEAGVDQIYSGIELDEGK